MIPTPNIEILWQHMLPVVLFGVAIGFTVSLTVRKSDDTTEKDEAKPDPKVLQIFARLPRPAVKGRSSWETVCVVAGKDGMCSGKSMRLALKEQKGFDLEAVDAYAVVSGARVVHDDTRIHDMDHYDVNIRLRGGIDFQNRAGVKFGRGGPMSSSHERVQQQERLRQLAMETMDISKDPYYMRNNTGGCECKLCLTSHKTEANYMAHTQGRRHQENLRKRAKEESDREARSQLSD